ncbi:MAG TPA: LytTR family DNA-binding domain-containing protein [Ohtaekwangia sp.]|nr:LytTR family DNA-binding domain-containing protein [Ohtaekwangia sp.]
MINAIIIDDEEHCIERLSRLLAVHCADRVKVSGAYRTVPEGEAAVKNKTPDLIFLDIQLHDKTGFDLLEKIDVTQTRIIFTTAFEQYAIAAFKFSAIDYLLKPVSKEELMASVEKAEERIAHETVTRKYETLLHNLKADSGMGKKICLPTVNGFDFIKVDDIMRCESNGNYTVFYLNTGQKIMVAKTLKEFDTMLSSHNFFRVHHSHLVNLAYIKKYIRGNGGYVVLTDDAEVEVSTRRKEAFLARVSH